jgi:hypothetical protein
VFSTLEQVMDLVEAEFVISREFDGRTPTRSVDESFDAPATRLLEELEACLVDDPGGHRPAVSSRATTPERLRRLLATMQADERDDFLSGIRHMLRGWRDGWSELEPRERVVGLWRLVVALNAQMDALEAIRTDLTDRPTDARGVAPCDELHPRVTAEQAAQIAALARGPKPVELSDDGWAPTKVTDEPPAAWYAAGHEEPAWYVWFLPPYGGLGSSEVLVVSKRSGAVIRRQSARDEG